MPGTRQEFWREKLEGNKKRDGKTRRALKRRGWDVLIVWECQIGDLPKLKRRIVAFLGP